MHTNWPQNLLDAELPLEPFGTRPRSVLQQLGIGTLGVFLETDWATVQCWQLGAKARTELQAHRAAMGQTPQDVRAWLDSNLVDKLFSVEELLSDESIDVSRVVSRAKLVSPTELQDAPLSISDFSTRAQSVLERSSIQTLGAFLDVDIHALQATGLGVKVRAELLEEQAKGRRRVAEILSGPDAQNGLAQMREALVKAAQGPTLPAQADVRWVAENVLDLASLWPSLVRAIVGRNVRAYEVLARRFNLGDSGQYTHEELGLAMGVSRARIQQIEDGAVKKLRAFLQEGKLHGYAETPHPALRIEVETLSETLQDIGSPIPDAQVWEALTERYGSLSESQRPFFVVLLEVLGFKEFQAAPPAVLRPLLPVWLDDDDEKLLVVSIVNTGLRVLRESATPLSLFDVLINVNRVLGKQKRKTDGATLRRILFLCSGIEEVAEEVYQARWEELPSNVVRVERVLREWAEHDKFIATVNELRQEIVHRHARAGHNINTSIGAISGACAASRVLVNVGNSGWTLRENAGETRPVHEIIEEALRVINRPATVEEVAAYVMPRRAVADSSVPGLLQQHRKFQRVGRGLYALRAWGLSDAEPTRRGQEYQEQFDDALLEVFLDNDVQPLALAEVTRRLVEKLGWKENHVRNRLDDSPWLDTTPLQGNRLLAHWRNEPKDEPDPMKRDTKRGRIQNAARSLLSAAENRQLAGATLAALLERETGYSGPILYNSLAAMPDIVRHGEPRNMTYQLQA